MADANTGDKAVRPQSPQGECEEYLLRAMVEEGLTLRQLVGIFRRFLIYCRCGGQGRGQDAIR